MSDKKLEKMLIKDMRVSYGLLDDVCLDCCDQLNHSDCETCAIERLKKVRKRYDSLLSEIREYGREK